MQRPLASLCVLAALTLPSVAMADGNDPNAEPRVTGTSRHADIVDFGRFQMEDKRGYENLIILSPGILPPSILLRYDRLWTDSLSSTIGLGYGGISLDNDASYSVIRSMLGVNWHPIGNGFHGFFVSGRGELDYNMVDPGCDSDEVCADGSLTVLSVKALAGWRWVWNPGFSLGLGLGAQYASILAEAAAEDDSGNSVTEGTSFSGVFPAYEFSLGWAF